MAQEREPPGSVPQEARAPVDAPWVPTGKP
jgi:hypothetical protein